MVQTVTHEARTSGQGDLQDLTEVVAAAVSGSGLSAGIVTVAVVGSTAGVTTIEFEPGAVADFGAMFERLAPRNGAYLHHERWGDDNGSSHVRAALLGPSLTLPFTDGRVQPRHVAADRACRARYPPPGAGGWWCRSSGNRETSVPAEIPHVKVTLDNGLDVIVHEDHHCPIVAVNVWYHVGSKNERPGRTGFAHLFEHLMFEGSEHHDSGYFRPLQEVGGTLNGSTSADRTNYWEVVPRGALERALWMESDRMGYLLPALTREKLDTQREVVLNERRQSYENRPYGFASMTLMAAHYAADHPYHWPTIGWPDDVRAATLDDVREFFATYYHPANASLAIAGDVARRRRDPGGASAFRGYPRGTAVVAGGRTAAGALTGGPPRCCWKIAWNRPGCTSVG